MLIAALLLAELTFAGLVTPLILLALIFAVGIGQTLTSPHPRRGTGLGRELLRQCLAIVDSDPLPAFLETPNPRTISFYQRQLPSHERRPSWSQLTRLCASESRPHQQWDPGRSALLQSQA
jgi:hypothetical protein